MKKLPASDAQENADPVSARVRARQEQAQVEQRRLVAHQRIGVQLLSSPARGGQLLERARAEVQRWADLCLCNQDYIDRWNEWLALPVNELAERMRSDADG